ncbi:MAG: patatin-like phospholipase family protein [Caldilineaceae bacterium]|nr:patatin-like phospholipase family protein [Caldilineaceae bacterium]
MNKEYPFRNLVFRGGGVRCFAYHGVLEVLEEEGILAQIDRVAGTSAGAATAALVSFRLSADETVALFKRMNYAKVRRRLASDFRDWLVTPPKNMQDSVARLKGNLDAFGRLLSNYGWYANDYSQQWLEGIISEQCDGNGRATFAEFRERGFRDLYMVATNLERHREEIFSATTTPDVAVADALVLSQSIPLFFEAPRFDGKTLGEGTYYADGGLVNDYPLQLFDAPEHFAHDNEWYRGGVNWQTLGCRLYTPEDCDEPSYRMPMKTLIGYMSNLIETMMNAQEAAHRGAPADRARTIDISNCCVSSTDFDIQLDPPGETYLKLVDAGRTAAQAYLAAYKPPSPNNSSRSEAPP